MHTDIVTGARVDLELELAIEAERLWKLITDVSRIGEWSPECRYARWLDGHEAGGVGARFEARNHFAHGFVGQVVCEVTGFAAPQLFGWKVLDGESERAGSLWHYELVPRQDGRRVLVRHTFEHGPGDTGLRELVDQDPERGQAILNERRLELRQNMTRTLEGMAACA